VLPRTPLNRAWLSIPWCALIRSSCKSTGLGTRLSLCTSRGDGPCVLVCTGNRDLNDETFWRVYKRSDVARRYGASVEQDTSSGAGAKAPFRDRWRVERPEGWSELPWSSGW